VMLALLCIAIQFAVVALVIEGAVPPVWLILQPAAYAGAPPAQSAGLPERIARAPQQPALTQAALQRWRNSPCQRYRTGAS
jgi:hypothetical protein